MKVLNFYLSVYDGNLQTRQKTCTIRMGDKREKYAVGDLVWVAYGERFKPRRKVFAAVLDRVDIRTIAELSAADLAGENPDMRTTADAIAFLSRIYDRPIGLNDLATVIYFSEVQE